MIYEFLTERGEYFRTLDNKDATEGNIKALSCLFTNRIVGFEKEDNIVIGLVENDLFGETSENSLSIRFVKYLEETHREKRSLITTKEYILVEENEYQGQFKVYKIGIEIKLGINYHIIPIENDRPYRFSFVDKKIYIDCQFIRTGNIGREINGNLFDAIALTEKEQFVIDALKIIEPTTERIAFIGGNSKERIAVIKLANIATPLPLKSMGDGVNRILTIILALVNAQNGFLLIDEFENGLHYTVQKKLWKIIFTLAQKLKIQVFVTTHSEDCIAGFEKILNDLENKFDGKLIRLDNINGKIEQVEFDANDLSIATNQNIEIR